MTTGRGARGARTAGRLFARALALVTVTAAGLAAPRALTAQTIVGRVLDEVRESPVDGAAVRLLDRNGKERASTVSDSAGRFTLRPPREGDYYLAAERIGYEATRSPLLALHEGGSTPVDLMMTPRPVGLEGLTVETEAVAAEQLRQMGIDPVDLGSSFVTQEQIDAIQVKRDVGSVLEWQHINGLRVIRPENTTTGGGGGGRTGADDTAFEGMCISLVRGRTGIGGGTCALPVLDGLPIDDERLLNLDPETIGAIAVLQPIDARILYGKRADHGAVLFWSKGRR